MSASERRIAAGLSRRIPPPERRCKATTKAGERCTAWAVQKPEIQNPSGFCSGHLKLGLASAPQSYGRLGSIASRRLREEAKLHAEGEQALTVLREALAEGSFTDPILDAQAKQLLDRKTLSALEAKQATRVAQTATETARAKAERERALDERIVESQFGDLSPESWAKFEAWIAQNEESRRRGVALRKRQAQSEQAASKREVPIESLPRRKRRRRSGYLPPHIAYKDPATIAAYERRRDYSQYSVPVELLNT